MDNIYTKRKTNKYTMNNYIRNMNESTIDGQEQFDKIKKIFEDKYENLNDDLQSPDFKYHAIDRFNSGIRFSHIMLLTTGVPEEEIKNIEDKAIEKMAANKNVKFQDAKDVDKIFDFIEFSWCDATAEMIKQYTTNDASVSYREDVDFNAEFRDGLDTEEGLEDFIFERNYFKLNGEIFKSSINNGTYLFKERIFELVEKINKAVEDKEKTEQEMLNTLSNDLEKTKPKSVEELISSVKPKMENDMKNSEKTTKAPSKEDNHR